MVDQKWIGVGKYHLLAVEHWPESAYCLGTVLLLPGFFHPMCDLDYFMSKLARRLKGDDFRVIQLDMAGMGDSPGASTDVCLTEARDGLRELLHRLKEEGPAPVYGIGRGLNATLLSDAAAGGMVQGIAGIAPYRMDLAARSFVRISTAQDARYLFPGSDYVNHTDFAEKDLVLLSALGCQDYHLHGVEVSGQFFTSLQNYPCTTALRPHPGTDYFWIIPGTYSGPSLPESGLTSDQYLTAYRAFRDPKLQHQMVEDLTQWLSHLNQQN